MHRDELARYLDRTLDAARVADYCPNGLQVEGRAEIRSIVSGVTASIALIEAGLAAGADALLVHHGHFCRGEDPRLVGSRKRRIALLLANDVSLFAYHLPLDLHPELGNDAQLARQLDVVPEGHTGAQELVAYGSLRQPVSLERFGAHVAARLARAPLVIGDPLRQVGRVAWCTGAAQDRFEEAIAIGVDAYLTGEIAEQHVHLARESGVAFVAAGHHATERFGVEAVGEHLAAAFGIAHRFVDVPNPV